MTGYIVFVTIANIINFKYFADSNVKVFGMSSLIGLAGAFLFPEGAREVVKAVEIFLGVKEEV